LQLADFCIIASTAVVVIGYIVFAMPIVWIEPLSAIFYFANYLEAHYIVSHSDMQMPFAHFWSLSIEEHFYLLFPITFVMLAWNSRKLLLALVAVCLMCLIFRLIAASEHPEYLGSFYYYLPSEFRLDSIAYGVLLAIACETESGRRIVRAFGQPAIVSAALLLLLATFAIRSEWFRATFQYSMQKYRGRYLNGGRYVFRPISICPNRFELSAHQVDWHVELFALRVALPCCLCVEKDCAGACQF
jgi:peptidoglycan/LPS O-acetylase OafA/YrhL